MNIIEKDIKDIKAYDNNPRLTGEAIDGVANSIKSFGWMQPIVIDKSNIIVAGHVRAQAALQLGLKKVPCLVAENLTDEQIKAYRLADNKTAEFALWDYEKLDMELESIGDIDMSDFGFIKVDDFDSYEAPEEDEDSFSEDIATDKPKERNIRECTCPKCGFVFEV